MNAILPDEQHAVEELLSLIDKATFGTYEILEFRGLTFSFFYIRPDPAIAWYKPLERARDYEVYVVEGLPREWERRCIFHEMWEASLISKGWYPEEAHPVTLGVEEEIFGPRGAIPA